MFIHDNHDHSDDGGDNDVDDAHIEETETRMNVIVSLYYTVDDRNQRRKLVSAYTARVWNKNVSAE